MLANRNRMAALAVTSIVTAFFVSTTWAQSGAPPKMPKAPAADQPKPDFPKFEEAMKDYKEVPTAEPPFLTLWYNKKEDSLRAQIPGSLIGQQFLVATSMAGGPSATGFQLDHFLAYFERMDKKLVLMEVDPRYVTDGKQPICDVIKRSYGADIILKSVNIITTKNGDLIIDFDGLFKNDFAQIGRYAGGSVNAGLSKWAKYKAFPQNVEMTADLAVMRGSTGRRVLVHYSLSKIPESSKGYKPRVADDRVGYFLTVRKDWTKKHDEPTLFDRYINRWRLEKRDPSAEFSAPKNPIIWYIEKTVPLRYRRYVKEGILDWNKAFEKCGFLDAIEVIQQEDYDQRTKDLDPEDVRYNFFRWIATGRAFAMGPSRAHPLTGQIFDADIVCDDSFVRVFMSDYKELTGGSEMWEPYNPFLEDFYRSHPEWVYHSTWDRLLPNVRTQANPDDEFRNNLMRHMFEQGRPMCECAAGLRNQLQFANFAMEAKGMTADQREDYLGQVIKELVVHEVGHCLGLRHNFKSSTWLPMKEIEEHNRAGEPTVGSVMDYSPTIIAPRGEEQGSFTTRSIGPYDYWAIEYGYRPVAKPYKDEKEMLEKVAARGAEAGLDYATDEDTMSFLSPDPYSNRYDMGRDVIEFAKRQTKLSESLLADIKDWAVKDGQSFTHLRRAFRHVLAQRAYGASYVGRFCGGQVINRDHKGDPDARTPIQVVPAKKQRKALSFLCKTIFAEDAYEIDPELLGYLAPGRFSHWGSDEFTFQVEFNIHDFISAMQFRCLTTVMNPFTINRIHDNQVKFGEEEEVYTLAEHITALTDAIWSELDDEDREGTDRKPFINSFRRNLQREFLGMLTNMVLSEPGGLVPSDANAIARYQIRALAKKIGKRLKGEDIDLTSRAHLTDIKTRIDKILDAEYRAGGFGGGGSFIFFRTPQEQESRPITVLPQH